MPQYRTGRAEVIAGSGVFTESFPLFGYDVADSDRLSSASWFPPVMYARQLGKSGLFVLVGARNPALGEVASERLRGESRPPRLDIGCGGRDRGRSVRSTCR